MTTLTEGVHGAEFILGELEHLSKDTVTLLTGQNLVSGTVLGKITTGTSASAAAFSGNTGNGAMGAITVSAGAKFGDYKLVMIEPGTDAGKFQVEGPDGKIIGTGTVGQAFSKGGLAFTLADGATDFVSGDGFTITVASGSGKWKQFNQDAADGSQSAAGVLLHDADATAADIPIVAITRHQEVIDSKLIWPSDIDPGEKTAAIAQLAGIGIIVR